MILLFFSLVLVALATSIYIVYSKKASVSDPFLHYKNCRLLIGPAVKSAVRPMLGMIETEETLQKKRESLKKRIKGKTGTL